MPDTADERHLRRRAAELGLKMRKLTNLEVYAFFNPLREEVTTKNMTLKQACIFLMKYALSGEIGIEDRS